MPSSSPSRPKVTSNMFGPKVIEEFDSKYSGNLRVMQIMGDKYVSTGYWTQSGGIIKEVWKPAFKKMHAPQNKSWLILGLATGTIAKMLPQPAKIVGVEIDPAMITIGKKYFGLDQISNLEIVVTDAQKFKSSQTFDYVLVDLYCIDNLPEFVYSPKFLSNLRNSSSLVVFNHLFHSEDQKKNALELVKKLEKIFTKVDLLRSLTNLLIICS